MGDGWRESGIVSGLRLPTQSGKEIKLGDKTHKLMLYDAGEVVPVTETAVVAVPATATALAVAAIPAGSVPANVSDRIGTIYKGAHWSIAGKGQSGRTDEIIKEEVTGADDDVDIDIEVVATSSLVSMQRVLMDDGTYAMGTQASSWGSSVPPSANFADGAKGLVVGTPGIAPDHLRCGSEIRSGCGSEIRSGCGSKSRRYFRLNALRGSNLHQ